MTTLRAPLPAFGAGREFERILAILRDGPAGTNESARGPAALVGPGDDAAVLPGGMVISTDLGVEGVHFRLDWISAKEAGYRIAAAGLSDLAAMAAAPAGVLASAGAPGDGHGAEELMAGVRALLRELGIELLGGDLVRSPGPLILDIVSVGWTDDPLLRSGAGVGDELWVTGMLGGAAAAVALWESGARVPAGLRRAFASPRPRVAEAQWLARAGAVAGIDLSDGLASDAAHLGAASGVGVLLVAGAVPLDPALGEADLPGEVNPLDLALAGGDDYELLVASPPGRLETRREAFEARFGIALTRVGRVTEGPGVALDPRVGGHGGPDLRGGFDHFGRGAP